LADAAAGAGQRRAARGGLHAELRPDGRDEPQVLHREPPGDGQEDQGRLRPAPAAGPVDGVRGAADARRGDDRGRLVRGARPGTGRRARQLLRAGRQLAARHGDHRRGQEGAGAVVPAAAHPLPGAHHRLARRGGPRRAGGGRGLRGGARAAALPHRPASQHAQERKDAMTGTDYDSAVALIGMSGRFPGAASVADLWRNLLSGIKGLRTITDEELREAGVDPGTLADPRYVRVRGPLEGLDTFDATVFGVNPREAEMMDPQHRLFLECSWEALESAGYCPTDVPGQVAVFGGCGFPDYIVHNIRHASEQPGGALLAAIGNERD